MDHSGGRDDVLAGATFVAFGGGFAYTASTYDVGSLLAMGPGYFPLVLGAILAGLGLVIMTIGLLSLRRKEAPAGVQPVESTTGPEPDERGSVPWGRAGLLLLAILLFGATIEGLGLAPALLVTVFLAALAGRGTKWRTAALISIGLTGLSVAIFVLLLQLRIPLVGPWLGG